MESDSPLPTNSLVSVCLTDFYQLTMTYALYRANRHTEPATFELFFRKCPFHGEFAIFAGLDEVVKLFCQGLRPTREEREFIREKLSQACGAGRGQRGAGGSEGAAAAGGDLRAAALSEPFDEGFLDWLDSLDLHQLGGSEQVVDFAVGAQEDVAAAGPRVPIRVWALREGTCAFGREPLLRVEAPLAIGQLLETPLLLLLNFPTLVATNAMRMRLAADGRTGDPTGGPGGEESSAVHRARRKLLIEFGLRRAQGPDGAISASKYAYVGGFDGTSNVTAARLTGIDLRGTHAHSFVMAHRGLQDLKSRQLVPGSPRDAVERCMEFRRRLVEAGAVPPEAAAANEGELAAFIAYAQCFPGSALLLVDTYDTLQSGVPNFLAVAAALHEEGFRAVGIRLDSGDLAFLSREVRAMFRKASEVLQVPGMADMLIFASNDINEDVLHSLNKQGHEIDAFGIGTHLVTCQAQPALGGVYKLVEINGHPCIKLSQDVSKVVIPGAKSVYRLFGRDGAPILDLLQRVSEPPPQPGVRILCRHPFDEATRAYVTPQRVEALQELIWDGPRGFISAIPSMDEVRAHAERQVASLREDILRSLNPTPYKVSVSQSLYEFFHELWLRDAPVAELS